MTIVFFIGICVFCFGICLCKSAKISDQEIEKMDENER